MSEPPADADTDTSPLHRSEVPLTVLIFVPDTSVACLASNAACVGITYPVSNATAKVPVVVTGEPLIVNPVGTDNATEVTVPTPFAFNCVCIALVTPLR